jgi:integrase
VPRPRRTRRAYGSGTVYEKRPGSWVVAWRENGRRRYSEALPSKDLAEALRAKMERDRHTVAAGLPLPAGSFPALGTLGDLWLERRRKTHRSHVDDTSRWKRHVRPHFGHLRPAEIDHAGIRRFVETKLGELGPATVGHCVRLLSTLLADLIERPTETGIRANPVRTLPRSTRRLYRSRHRPQDTPFLERLEDAPRIIAALPSPFDAMYAVGLYGMLRPGEILGLCAEDVNTDRRQIRVWRQVQDAKLGPLKDDESRLVPIQRALAPFLAARILAAGGTGLLFPTTRQRGGGRHRRPPTFIQPHTVGKAWKTARTAAGIPALTWYQATRHSGASHWVMSGGNLGRLASILGHSTTWVTEHYAHLTPGRFSEEDFERLSPPVDSRLAPRGGVSRLPKRRKHKK